MLFSTVVATLALVAGVSADTHSKRAKDHARRVIASRSNATTIEKRAFTGRGTWYYTGTGNQVSCGGWGNDEEFTVALNEPQYGSSYPGPHCGKKIWVEANGKRVHGVTITDTCPSPYCAWGALDLTPGLFRQFADQGVGTLELTWDFEDGGDWSGGNNGGGNNGGGNQWEQPKWEEPKAEEPKWEEPKQQWEEPKQEWQQPTPQPEWTPPAEPSHESQPWHSEAWHTSQAESSSKRPGVMAAAAQDEETSHVPVDEPTITPEQQPTSTSTATTTSTTTTSGDDKTSTGSESAQASAKATADSTGGDDGMVGVETADGGPDSPATEAAKAAVGVNIDAPEGSVDTAKDGVLGGFNSLVIRISNMMITAALGTAPA